jgi:hypothetical protein
VVSKLGRSPQNGIARADVIYQKLVGTEPEPPRGGSGRYGWRRRGLARQRPLYFDLTVSLSSVYTRRWVRPCGGRS